MQRKTKRMELWREGARPPEAEMGGRESKRGRDLKGRRGERDGEKYYKYCMAGFSSWQKQGLPFPFPPTIHVPH